MSSSTIMPHALLPSPARGPEFYGAQRPGSSEATHHRVLLRQHLSGETTCLTLLV